MDSDILPILQDWGTRDLKSRIVETLLRDAADEIERLRSEVTDLHNTHRAVRALTWEIARQNPSHLKAWIDVRLMVADEKEARRG